MEARCARRVALASAFVVALELGAAVPARAQKIPSLPPAKGRSVGNLAYDFTLKDLDGRTYDLEEMRGKWVVQVVFWATWCVPCIEEVPRLRELYAKYHGQGLEILGVVVNLSQTQEGVRAFARRFQINYPILWDEDGSMMDHYLVDAIPRNFLIDRDGIIRYTGSALPGGYEPLLQKLLRQEGSARGARPDRSLAPGRPSH